MLWLQELSKSRSVVVNGGATYQAPITELRVRVTVREPRLKLGDLGNLGLGDYVSKETCDSLELVVNTYRRLMVESLQEACSTTVKTMKRLVNACERCKFGLENAGKTIGECLAPHLSQQLCACSPSNQHYAIHRGGRHR